MIFFLIAFISKINLFHLPSERSNHSQPKRTTCVVQLMLQLYKCIGYMSSKY